MGAALRVVSSETFQRYLQASIFNQVKIFFWEDNFKTFLKLTTPVILKYHPFYSKFDKLFPFMIKMTKFKVKSIWRLICVS